MTDTQVRLMAILSGRKERTIPGVGFTCGLEILPRLECVDGFSVSMQADEFKYCSPRDNSGPWYKVELGFPSAVPTDEVMEYAENKDDPTGTVYGYVPIQVVARLIDEHGGLKETT